MDLYNKIEKILIEKKIKASTFMQDVGMSKTAFYSIKNGKTKKLSEEMAKKISDKFTDYPYKWLLTNAKNSDFTSLDDFNKSDILDYILEKRKEFLMEEREKINLLIDVFATVEQNLELNKVNQQIEELKQLIKAKK
ncbi:hypothetical protein T190115A13A_90019 [Tenacibaculum sp. 190524A02b]|uniref:HTH cro/C1-type domain-containing protein n=1 Tax=Tenacibaculum vairaonense TaxID=3137860 RepID=A0ABP1FE76_9FLAO